jgi:hypothetical protein
MVPLPGLEFVDPLEPLEPQAASASDATATAASLADRSSLAPFDHHRCGLDRRGHLIALTQIEFVNRIARDRGG